MIFWAEDDGCLDFGFGCRQKSSGRSDWPLENIKLFWSASTVAPDPHNDLHQQQSRSSAARSTFVGFRRV